MRVAGAVIDILILMLKVSIDGVKVKFSLIPLWLSVAERGSRMHEPENIVCNFSFDVTR